MGDKDATLAPGWWELAAFRGLRYCAFVNMVVNMADINYGGCPDNIPSDVHYPITP